MCEFCAQHGEGKKWYLAMRNYSRELLADTVRREYLEDVLVRFEEEAGREGGKLLERLRSVEDVPVLNNLAKWVADIRQKRNHWGQVVPIEDVERIVDLQDSIVRFPCPCRRTTTGRDARYCFGLGQDETGVLGKYPDYSLSLENLEKEEAKSLLREMDAEGTVHSVWTFKTPYIGAICNCDQDCIAYRIQVKGRYMQLMFRAEYIAAVDWDLCNGCKKCISQCHFGAIHFSNAARRPTIETRLCYGCGLCRTVCSRNAIRLRERNIYPEAPW